jgi:hypothetical protein
MALKLENRTDRPYLAAIEPTNEAAKRERRGDGRASVRGDAPGERDRLTSTAVIEQCGIIARIGVAIVNIDDP